MPGQPEEMASQQGTTETLFPIMLCPPRLPATISTDPGCRQTKLHSSQVPQQDVKPRTP